MIARSLVLVSMLTLTAGEAAAKPAEADATLEVRIDAWERSAPVSPYEYGMFIEPIGNLVARTLWAEMLDDRKFYADVSEASPLDTVPVARQR